MSLELSALLLMQGTHSGFEVSSLGSLFRSGGFATYTPQATQAAASIAVFVLPNRKTPKQDA